MDSTGTTTRAPSGATRGLEEHLLAIETALDRGDVETARDVLARARHALNPAVPAPPPRLRAVGDVVLTDREAATLRRLTDGSMSQKDIARDLRVTRNTVKTHLRSLYLKLGAHCRGEAIQRARELGLLSSPLDAVGPPTEPPVAKSA